MGVSVLRGRMTVVPPAVGRESQLDDGGSVLESVGPLGGALQ